MSVSLVIDYREDLIHNLLKEIGRSVANGTVLCLKHCGGVCWGTAHSTPSFLPEDKP